MQKSFALALVLTLTLALPATAQETRTLANPMAAGAVDGRAAAESIGTGGYLAGGLGSGLILGLIGTGVTWAIAGSSDTSLPAVTQAQIQPNGPEYIQGFQSAYGERLKAKRKSSALTGGLIGTAAFLVIYLSAT